MSITIYTYRDPYSLSAEPFWNEITSCPYFCVSQTLANGLRVVYGGQGGEFSKFGVRTVKELIDSIYPVWQSTASAVKQNAAIDNIVNSKFSGSEMAGAPENIRRAFLFNREEVFSSIRTLFELDVKVDEIIMDLLTPEQTFIVNLYTRLKTTPGISELFTVGSGLTQDEIDTAIFDAMGMGDRNLESSIKIPSRVVIHGVHQFTPLMLRAIEEISRYKKVILIFGYQPQYKSIYQTWVDVYSSFDCSISSYGGKEYTPSPNNPDSYFGNLLADALGKLANGHMSSVKLSQTYEIIRFDNMTEFAGYVANLYIAGRSINPKNPLSAMREHIYAADSSVNKILKVYFPDQFGERQFLNYPLGHFFVAIASMWDASHNKVVINDINDIRECLMAGILYEDYLGELSTIFDSVDALFVGCNTIDDMLVRIKGLQRSRRRMQGTVGSDALRRIAYYKVSDASLNKLRRALNELKDLSAFFYDDFERRPNNFRAFYKKLKQFLRDQILDSRELDSELEDIVRRVYKRLEEVGDIDASASFECLKSTMSIYLAQEEGDSGGANWIVRNFEQIDGDILRSSEKRPSGELETYHFACLSDEDINSTQVRPFPWPLDDEFFLVAQEPIDWKYQVYVKARKEYRHFKAYALLFGLEFNRAGFKLSYVKRDGERERTPYSRLTVLGAKTVPLNESRAGHRLSDLSFIDVNVSGTTGADYDKFDLYRFRICKYRFLLESLIESGTTYKDSFLLSKYLEALLENRTRNLLQGLPLSESVLVTKLNEALEDLERCFPYAHASEKADAANTVRKRLLKSVHSRFEKVGQPQRDNMLIREVFLQRSLTNSLRRNVLDGKFDEVDDGELASSLSQEALDHFRYKAEPEVWCTYCPNREICAAFYTQR